MDVLSAWITGLILVFSWPAIGFLFLGIFMGLWLGAIPGLGGILGLVILLPFTFSMDTVSAIALLLGVYAVTSTSDTISSVLLGIPGTVSSQATILDGYPLTQKGLGARTLSSAFIVSGIGGVFSALILAFSFPLLLPIIERVHSPEILMLGVLGLVMVGSLSGQSISKGLIAALLGLLFATVGYAETDATVRFDFGTEYLTERLPLVPVVLGLFALPELADLAVRGHSISSYENKKSHRESFFQGLQDVITHRWLVFRSLIIGVVIGILPGIGSGIADWIAYGSAVQTAKDKSQFGLGDIRGVIAPETANNAAKGGSLIPMVAFGIPGSIGTAILMGALIIQGVKPGIEMLTTKLHITFTLVWTIAIANVVISIVLLFLSKHIARIAFISGHILVPGALLFVFMGAWIGNVSIGDWVTCVVMGVIGTVMKRSGWPRPPLVLAFVLGGIIENSFHLSIQAYDTFELLSRPAIIVILLVGVFMFYGILRRKVPSKNFVPNTQMLDEVTKKNPFLSCALSFSLLCLFVYAGIETLEWSFAAKGFPFLIVSLGLPFLGISFFVDARAVMAKVRSRDNSIPTVRFLKRGGCPLIVSFFGYLVCMIFASLLIGQKFALLGLMYIYLRRWGHYNVKVAIGYIVAGWIVLITLYDQVMHIIWLPSFLGRWLTNVLPNWVPIWLIA